MSIDRNIIAKKIISLLEQFNISASELSLELGYSRGYIQSLITGRALPKMEPFFDICDYFEITPMQFFAPEPDELVQKDTALLNKTCEELQKLNDDDLLVILNLVKRLQILNKSNCDN